MEALEFDLPWPPSVNNYYRHVGPRVLISRAGRKYRTMVVSRLGGLKKLSGAVSLSLECYPPDRRRRDLDNLLKCLQDSITAAGVLDDDSQIRRLQMEMLEPIEGGLVHVRLETLPERRGQGRVRPPSR
ncbi:MAG: RusA family crossover junction endodeoxyribonuclease [Kiritimatiellae bacterium]|nr:RusA family crossover junction endodeoxyribonuclease [Kiritimatiellia bacterium]MBR0196591.1 RusA family crossover junction endodeoxyribonuclease [Kiritimatiellia bacterium]